VSDAARPIKLKATAEAEIRREAARAYPHEGCGALVGPAEGEVSEAVPIENRESAEPRTRFTVAPLDYLAAEEGAEARGLNLLGLLHSHPDHPARPSETDRRYAWPGLLTLVIAVERGEPRELTAWDVPGPEAPFRRVELEVVT
jgi:proteasome lid subunit RPN8/RPN11